MNKKSLEEIAKQKGKKLLVESFQYSGGSENVEVYTEGQRLVESFDGQRFKARGVLKQVPVTRYTRNNNNRIYPKTLWEKVYEKNLVEGANCLTDHATDDGSVRNICGVWHNFKVLGETSVADLYCVGDEGQHLLEVAQAQGRCGFSTVAFGELDENDTVNADTFEFSRIDWVINPSQNVYGTRENVDESSLRESTESLRSPITKETTSDAGKVKPLQEKSNMVTKIEEANLRNQVNDRIRQAVKGENLVESIQSLRSIIVPEGFEVLNENISSAIEKLELKLHEQKESADKQIVTATEKLALLESENKVLSEKLQKAVKVLELAEGTELSESVSLLQEELKKSKDQIEVQSKRIASLKEDRSNMYSDLKIFNEDTQKRDKDIRILVEDTQKRDRDIRFLTEDHGAMNHDIKCLTEDRVLMERDIKVLFEQLKKAEKLIKFYEKKLEEMDYDFDDASEDEADAGEEPKEGDELDLGGEAGEEGGDAIETYTFGKDLEGDIQVDKNSKEVVGVDLKKPEGEEEPAGEEGGDLSLDLGGEEKDDTADGLEAGKKDESYSRQSTKSNLEESTKAKLSEAKQVEVIYEKFAREVPGLATFKKQIMESKSALEAIKKINSIRSTKDELVEAKTTVDKIKATSRPSWLGNRI